jgi:hypothetical protein
MVPNCSPFRDSLFTLIALTYQMWGKQVYVALQLPVESRLFLYYPGDIYKSCLLILYSQFTSPEDPVEVRYHPQTFLFSYFARAFCQYFCTRWLRHYAYFSCTVLPKHSIQSSFVVVVTVMTFAYFVPLWKSCWLLVLWAFKQTHWDAPIMGTWKFPIGYRKPNRWHAARSSGPASSSKLAVAPVGKFVSLSCFVVQRLVVVEWMNVESTTNVILVLTPS